MAAPKVEKAQNYKTILYIGYKPGTMKMTKKYVTTKLNTKSS